MFVGKRGRGEWVEKVRAGSGWIKETGKKERAQPTFRVKERDS
jgi:hypothetical protein